MGLFKKKANEPDPEAQQRLLEQVATVRAVLANYSSGTRLSFGAPTRCPHCGDYGFVQSVNKVLGVTFNHCFGCRADWVISLEALRVVEADPQPFHATEARTEDVVRQAPPVTVPATIVLDEHPTVAAETPAADAVSPTIAAPAPAPAPTPTPTPTPAPAGRLLRVLVVEQNPFDLAGLEELVELIDPPTIELLTAGTRADAERLARTSDHDVILLNLELPDSSGIATLLEWQHSAVSAAPVIIMGSSPDPETIRAATSLGAVHVIQRSQLEELVDAGALGAERFARLLRSTIRRAGSVNRSV